MKTPSALLVVGTLLVAGSAALLARVLLSPPPPAPVKVAAPVVVETPKPAYPAILVAARDLRPGDFLDASAVRWQASDSVHEERLYFLEGQEAAQQLTGASVRRAVSAGQPLTSALVVKPNEAGFIATVLSPGMRAITIPTDQTASQHGMLASGDRVDVMVNLERGAEDDIGAQSGSAQVQSRVPRLATQTLLQNVRVLSLDNQARSPLQPRPSDTGKSKHNPDAYPSVMAQTVTLEVPPIYAERLALASQIGTLQLALRSSQEADDDQVRAGSSHVTTLAQTTSVYRATSPLPGQRPPVITFHGDVSNTVQFGTP